MAEKTELEKLRETVDSIAYDQKVKQREEDNQRELDESKADLENRQQNFTSAMELMNVTKKTFGNNWIAKNYLRIYLAFNNEVVQSSDWHEFIQKSLTRDMKNDQKKLCLAYDDLIYSQAQTKETRNHYSDVRESENQKKAKKKETSAGIVSIIILTLGTICIVYSSMHIIYKYILIPIYFLGVLVFTLKRTTKIITGWDDPSLPSYADLESQYLSLIRDSKLSVHFKAAKELRECVFTKKTYLIPDLLKSWDSDDSYIFSGSLKSEPDKIKIFIKEYEENVANLYDVKTIYMFK